MGVRKLVEVWDGKDLIKENISFLKKPTKSVNLPYSDNIKLILNDLLDTYRTITCAGIAANQIGYDKRIFIGMMKDDEKDEESNPPETIGNPHADNYEFYINPQIDHCTNKSVQEGEEGCLSIPEVRLITERYDKIKVRYFNAEGKKIVKPMTGFLSRLFQHELDHLNGVLMVENSKIKSIYRISDNKNIDKLYLDLAKQLQSFL